MKPAVFKNMETNSIPHANLEKAGTCIKAPPKKILLFQNKTDIQTLGDTENASFDEIQRKTHETNFKKAAKICAGKIINNIDNYLPLNCDKNLFIKFLENIDKLEIPPNVDIPTRPEEIENQLLFLAKMNSTSGISINKDNVMTAVDKITEYLKSNNMTFKDPNNPDRVIEGKELLKFLPDSIENVVFDNKHTEGVARANDSRTGIIFTTGLKSTSIADLSKLIIHEALHCAFNSPSNSQREERFCETQAIEFAAKLIRYDSELDDFNIYGTSCLELGSNKDLLKEKIDQWIVNSGYSKYSETLTNR